MSGFAQAAGEEGREGTWIGDEFEHLAAIFPVMRKYDVRCPPREFYEAVNLAFHDAEAGVYDAIHKGMWDSLPRQFGLLSEDCLRHEAGNALRALDIGCGTGLSAQLLLATKLGERIRELHMLDTSEQMLDRARDRAQRWHVRTAFHRGTISDLAVGNQYDLILACSVLHHLADIPAFLAQVRQRQAARGIFMHLQLEWRLFGPPQSGRAHSAPDFNRGSEAELVKGHDSETASSKNEASRSGNKELVGPGRKQLYSGSERNAYPAGNYQERHDALDIWSVTDIHVHDGKGISIEEMKQCMPEHKLLSVRSYAFFGRLASELPQEFVEDEETMVGDNAPDGQQVGAVWMLDS